MPQAEEEDVAVQLRSARASPSVATRQLPLGGSDFRSDSQILPLRGRCPVGAEGEAAALRHHSRSWEPPPSVATRQLPRRGSDFRSEFPNSPPEGEMPPRGRGGGRPASLPFAQLGASPSVAARQLPLGGSDFRSDSQILPLRGRCPVGAEGEAALCRHYPRSWEPPPQSLRDSSPSGGAISDPIPKFSP